MLCSQDEDEDDDDDDGNDDDDDEDDDDDDGASVSNLTMLMICHSTVFLFTTLLELPREFGYDVLRNTVLGAGALSVVRT